MVTRKQRRRSRKLRHGGAPPQRRITGAGSRVTEVESETLLTKRERRRIDLMIYELRCKGADIPLYLLDYRFHEVRRKTGWNPRWKDERWGNVYLWWIQLDPVERQQLAELSRAAGMREND